MAKCSFVQMSLNLNALQELCKH